MNGLPETLEQLAARVDALEQRVHDLESGAAHPVPSAARILPTPAVAGPAPDRPSGEQISGAFLVLGKSMLGIAGAYLLRALAESGVLPRLVIAAVAFTYAVTWLIAASRSHSRSRFAPVLYSGTSALILAPMLWELTMRFHVLSPAAAAGVLGLFVGAASALSWNKEPAPECDLAFGTGAITALLLSIATHEMIAFLVLLLAMLALCEYKSIRGDPRGIRVLVAAAADCVAWFLVVIYRNPPGERSDYPALQAVALAAPASMLLAITAGFVVFRTAVLKQRITVFETVQSVVAFLLWSLSAVFLLPQVSVRTVGAVCLVFAMACYGAAYRLFRNAPRKRNFNVFAAWSLILSVTGTFLSLPPAWAIVCMASASVAAALIAARLCCSTLECHGIIYVGAAALGCGLLEYAYRALAGAVPETVGWSVLLVTACAAGSYGTARIAEGEAWSAQLLHLAPALLAAVALAALATHALVWVLSQRIAVEMFHVAFVRTLILCASALGLAFAGSRLRRRELKRIAYAALAMLAAKLVLEDLRHGHLGYIAAAISLFALTLIAVPRLARER